MIQSDKLSWWRNFVVSVVNAIKHYIEIMHVQRKLDKHWSCFFCVEGVHEWTCMVLIYVSSLYMVDGANERHAYEANNLFYRFFRCPLVTDKFVDSIRQIEIKLLSSDSITTTILNRADMTIFNVNDLFMESTCMSMCRIHGGHFMCGYLCSLESVGHNWTIHYW